MTGGQTDLNVQGRAVLEAQAFSRLIGTVLVHLAPGTAELSLPISDDLKQQHGFVHGGVISYLADNALTFAGGSKLAIPAVTSEMKINYVRPAIGEELIARAIALASGRTQSVVRCDVFVVDGGIERLCAVAQGTVVGLPKVGNADDSSPVTAACR